MTEPTDKEKCLNIADQCTATASNDLAASILVDGGSGTLRELLNDAADAIRAGWATPQPIQASDSVMEDAERWRTLPAFFEEYQIDSMKLYRDIDAYLDAARGQAKEGDPQ